VDRRCSNPKEEKEDIPISEEEKKRRKVSRLKGTRGEKEKEEKNERRPSPQPGKKEKTVRIRKIPGKEERGEISSIREKEENVPSLLRSIERESLLNLGPWRKERGPRRKKGGPSSGREKEGLDIPLKSERRG